MLSSCNGNGSIEITSVSSRIASGIRITTPDSTKLLVGQSLTLEVNTLNGEEVSDLVVFKSLNENIATYNEEGLITALSSGTVKVTITSLLNSNSVDTITVIVEQNGDSTSQMRLVEIITRADSIFVNDTVQLSSVIIPINNNSISLNWMSSDTSIVLVDNNGLMIGVRAGTVQIIAAFLEGDYSDTVTLKVVPKIPLPPVNISAIGIIINNKPTGSDLNKTYGNTLSLSAAIIPLGTSLNVIWSSDPAGQVDSNGSVRFTAIGEVEIIASTSDQSHSDKVFYNVSGELATGISINNKPTGIDLNKVYGDAITLTSTIRPIGTGLNVIWSSEPAGQVDLNGSVDFTVVGEVKIIASVSDGSYSDTVVYDVLGLPATGISIGDKPTGSDLNKSYGDTATLTSTISPLGTGLYVIWSSDPSGQVIGNGVVRFTATGEVIIIASASDGSYSDSIRFMVQDLATGISIVNTGGRRRTFGDTVSLSVVVGSTGSSLDVIWSSNPAGQVDSNGIAHFTISGEVIIMAETLDNAYSVGATFTVREPLVVVVATGIVINNKPEGNGLIKTIGNRVNLSATINPLGTGLGISWSSEPPGQVNQNGVVRFDTTGSVVIVAEVEDGSYSDEVIFTVDSLSGIFINNKPRGNGLKKHIGDTVLLTATIEPLGTGLDIVWSSEPEGYVDNNGLVRFDTTGRIKVIAKTSDGNSSVSVTFIVTPATGIVIDNKPTGSDLIRMTGSTFDLSATIMPLGTGLGIVWRSVPSGYVDSNGLVRFDTTGQIKVIAKASDGSYSSSVKFKSTLATGIVIDDRPTGDDLTKIIGDSVRLSTTISPLGTGLEVLWSSEPEGYVNSSGLVLFDSIGRITIKAKTSDKVYSTEIEFIVQDYISTGISIVNNGIDVEKSVGDSVNLSAIISPSGSGLSVLWSSEPFGLVDSNGFVRFDLAGEITITARTSDGGYSAQVVFTVTDGDNSRVTICHRTSSRNNPYVVLVVNASAIDGDRGHASHVADDKNENGDIIPITDLNGDGTIDVDDCLE